MTKSKVLYIKLCRRTKCTYFQYTYAIQLAILKHSYLNIFFVFSTIPCWFKVFEPRASGWGLIFSLRLDGWKVMQSVKSACSMLYLELKTSILPPLEGNDKWHKINSNNNRLKRPIYQLHFKNVWVVALNSCKV